MVTLPGAGGEERLTVRSRIGSSLVRLQQSLERHAELDGGLASLLEEWRTRWSRREGEIGRRLDRLAERLEGLPGRAVPVVAEHAPHESTCRLRLVGMTGEPDDLDLLLGY
jgi:hypothetical protein